MLILELLKALLIAIVEGITEWLPISSTGHMIIVESFISLNVSPEFWSMFLVVIQLGAIMAVIVLYFHRLNPFSLHKAQVQSRGTLRLWDKIIHFCSSLTLRRGILRLWAKVIVACIPAAVIGILFDDWFEEHFFNPVTVAIALVVYGIAFIVIERLKARGKVFNWPWKPHVQGAHARVEPAAASRAARFIKPDTITNTDDLSFVRALGVGLFQCLAIVPGTSRSGSTILGGRILGISRETAAEFSFFLAIPVMFGWSFLKLVKTFVLDSITLTSTEWAVFVVGIIAAFLVSLVAIKFLMNYIKNHSFEVFGWYRIALGVVVLAFFLFSGQLMA